MSEIIQLFLIGISLSLDAFSLSLTFGTLNLNTKNKIILSLIVGIFHFIMPLIGLNIGILLFTFIKIKITFIVGIIFLILGITMIKENNESKLVISIIGFIVFAFSVSIDSFSTGIGLGAITNYKIMPSIIFSITSYSFTFVGLIIGSYIESKLGKYASILGGIILIILSILYFLK